MSGAMNPLAQPSAAAAPAAPNPLTSGNGAPPPATAMQKGPLPVGVAAANIMAQGISPDQIAEHIHTLNAGLPEIGALARKTNVTRKDVVKSTADAVGRRQITAAEGIQFISSMPDDPEQLRPWLQAKFHAGLVSAVALHSVGHQMLAGGGAPAPAPAPQMPAGNALAAPGVAPAMVGAPQ